MENLTGPGNVIAVAFEVLGERDDIGQHRRPALVVVVDSGGGRSFACEQGRARGIAEWRRTVGVGEKGSAFGKPVDVRRGDAGVTFQATDPIVHVVHRDEEDVGTRCGCRAGKGGSRRSGEKSAASHRITG